MTVPLNLVENDVRETTFQVLEDIYNDGTFLLDISSDVESIDITNDLSLKSGGSIIGKPSTNVASITLFNETGRYSPNNANNVESEYVDGRFRTNSKIKIYCGFIDENDVVQTRCLFEGVITSFNGSYGTNKMTLGLKDYAKFLMKKKNPNESVVSGITYHAILFDSSISEALEYLIDYSLGTSFPRTIQSIPEKLPVIEFPIDQSVWQTIQNLCQACDGFAYFEDGSFKFASPLSSDWVYPITSQYTFTADNLYRFTESVDEDSIINKFKITSNVKTLQMRQILIGTFDTNVISGIDDYSSSDSKSALNGDGVTITLKSQADDLSWIDSNNVPLVYLSNQPQSLDELIIVNPTYTQTDVDDMNSRSLIKVWDKDTGNQLTVQTISYELGIIVLETALDPADYNIIVQYQYYVDRIVEGKYRWYQYDLSKTGANIEYPIIEVNDGADSLTYSYISSSNTLYLSDWEILNGNNRIKFKLTNNCTGSGIAYISQFQVWGNSLECVNPLMFEAIDGTTITEFENAYEFENNYILNIDFGQRLVDYYLFKYKDNLSFINGDCKFIPNIDLMDRVTITETVSGINFDFLVISIRHSIKLNENWKTIVQFESLISPWTYDPTRVTSLQYIQGPNYVNLYSFSEPPIPTSLTTTEETFLQESGDVVTRILVNFTIPSYSYFSHCFVQYSNDGGTIWRDYGNTVIGKLYIPNVQIGSAYIIRVQTVSLNGLTSDWLESSPLTIIGKDTPPSDVPGFFLIQTGSIVKVTVNPPEDPDISYYVIRQGASWENSILIKSFKDIFTTFEVTQEGVKNYWIKAVDNSGNESVNAKKVTLSIYNLPVQNIISNTSEDLSTWTANGMYRKSWEGSPWKINSDQQIGDYTYFADMFASGHTLRNDGYVIFPAIDLGTGIIEESYFYVDPWGFIQIQTVEKVSDYNPFFTMFDAGSFTYVSVQYAVETFLNVNITFNQTSNDNINIYYRTSVDGVTYTDWVTLVERQFFGRYIQIKLECQSLNDIDNVNITAATVSVDVPDVIDQITNVNLSAATNTINFNQKFYASPVVVPTVVNSSGKSCNFLLTNVTASSFDLEALNSSDIAINGRLLMAYVKGY